MSAIEKLKAQQAGVPDQSAPWMVAEQLMDLCRREPVCADLLDRDLDIPELSIIEAEKQIKAYADQHRTKNFACVTPVEAEKILRKFYGLPEPGAGSPGVIDLDLADFLG